MKTQTTHIDSLSQLLKICKEDGLPTQFKFDNHKVFKPHIFFGFTGYIGIPIHTEVIETLWSKKLIWLHSITCTNRYKHYVVVQDFIELLEKYVKAYSTNQTQPLLPVDAKNEQQDKSLNQA